MIYIIKSNILNCMSSISIDSRYEASGFKLVIQDITVCELEQEYHFRRGILVSLSLVSTDKD